MDSLPCFSGTLILAELTLGIIGTTTEPSFWIPYYTLKYLFIQKCIYFFVIIYSLSNVSNL